MSSRCVNILFKVFILILLILFLLLFFLLLLCLLLLCLLQLLKVCQSGL